MCDVAKADSPHGAVGAPHSPAQTGVGVVFSCSHRDLVRNEVHGHSYEAVAWFPADPPHDATLLQLMLAKIVETALDHKTLPDHMTRAEDIRAMLLQLISIDCVDVEIRRPLERLYVRGAR